MDLTFSEKEIAFRDELRGWLAENPPSPEPTDGGEDAHYAWRRDWQRTLYDAGWAAPGWPAGVVADGAAPGCGVVDPGAVCGDGLLSSVWAWVCARCRSICGML